MASVSDFYLPLYERVQRLLPSVSVQDVQAWTQFLFGSQDWGKRVAAASSYRGSFNASSPTDTALLVDALMKTLTSLLDSSAALQLMDKDITAADPASAAQAAVANGLKRLTKAEIEFAKKLAWASAHDTPGWRLSQWQYVDHAQWQRILGVSGTAPAPAPPTIPPILGGGGGSSIAEIEALVARFRLEMN